MFHPTAYENIKVTIENQIYDYDNLDGILAVTDRSDLLDMALMSREFNLSFQLKQSAKITTQIVLTASTKDLSEEILESFQDQPGCSLILRFYRQIEDIPAQCHAIEQVLLAIWGPELAPIQTLSFTYGAEQSIYTNCIELQFNRQITEDNIEDIPNLLSHLLQSAQQLELI